MPIGVPASSRAECTLSSARSTSRATWIETAGGELAAVARDAAQQAVEVASVDELHREPRLVAIDARRIDLHHIGVAHRCVEGCFALEHRPALGVGDEVRQQPLDDELARLRLRILRAGHVHLGRTPHGQPRVEPVWSELDRPS